MGAITSPVKRYPGTVELPDAFSWDQLAQWATDIDAIPDNAPVPVMLRAQLQAICNLGLSWHLAGIVERPQLTDIPTKPLMAAVELAGWLMREIGRAIYVEDGSPNE